MPEMEIVLGKGDVVVRAAGEDITEVANLVSNEARYWSDGAVVIERVPRSVDGR